MSRMLRQDLTSSRLVTPSSKLDHDHLTGGSNGQHSSAYSSLANSTTEINEKVGGGSSSPGMGTLDSCGSSVNSASGSSSAAGRSAEQIRTITQDYNTLLKRATDQIKSLAKEKYELEVR